MELVLLQNNTLYVTFEGNNKKTLNYQICQEKGLIELL